MICQDLLSAPAPALAATATLAEAAEALARHRADALAVVDAAGHFTGLFGLSDLLALIVPRVALAGDMKANLRFVADEPGAFQEKFAAIKTRPVGEWCDRGAVTLAPEAPAIDALRLFCRGHRSIALVGRDGRLAGVLGAADAIRVITGGA